ncbi:hypothetical protein MTP10_18835 [Nonomuraea sp. 3-1Str]|uniref:hypothetical protein n=1 Tax=Nonomuraea sp. 3-1Str TaxID=2929801 RepID=UPI00286670E3|nr:hypothetical protein [Nonomuraea sp. 3-1Str]MDR8410786.1 hypothetical protein [Nonomuraea sp. 3-1Str]
MSTKTYRYQSEYAQQIRAEGVAVGKVEGEAVMLIRVLEARAVEVTPAVREKIMSCTDTDVLEAWAARAVSVTTADELFD